jgi:hypothetical protein
MLKRIKNVRLSDHDLDVIKNLFRKHFLEGDKLWIFGSRVDLTRKGGDIDLYVETSVQTIVDAIKIKTDFISDLEQNIGEQKIDLVLNILNFPHPLLIHDVAKTKGVRII